MRDSDDRTTESSAEGRADEVRLPALEIECARCKESGLRNHWCSECHGTGYVLTEAGKAILRVVKRHVSIEGTVIERR